LSSIDTCRLNFCLFYIFRSRQAGTVSTVLLSVSLTPAKHLFGSVVDTDEQFFGGVVDNGDKFQAV
jgi:hypothetical protein